MSELAGFNHYFAPPKVGGAPTILALHGTGGTEHDLVPLVQSLWPGAGILAPRGRISENGANRFFRRFAEGIFDLENLRSETLALADFVTAAVRQYQLDEQSIEAIGFSNGANIAASLLLLRPEVLSSAVLLRAMTPFEPQSRPDLTGKRVLLAAGRFDPMVPADNIENLACLLRSGGAEVTLNWVQSGHNLTSADIEAIKVWLRAPTSNPA